MNLILAHDIGTTGVKATVFRDDGSIVASTFASYPTDYPAPGWCEQDPLDWWTAVVSATRELMSTPELDASKLVAVGLSGHMMGCLPVAEDGTPVGRAMIHSDTRSAGIAQATAARVGRRVYEVTGNPADSHYPAPKIAWLAANEPERYRAARWFLQSKDWVAGKLTGRFGLTDCSDASLYGCFDLKKRVWSDEVTELWGIDPAKLPEVVASSTVIGRVTREAALETGLPAGLPVVIGGGDGACAAVGAGAVEVGDAYNYLGSTSWVASITDAPVIDPEGRLFSLCSLDGITYGLLGTVQAAGTSFAWAADVLGREETARAQAENLNRYELLDNIARNVAAGSNGLIFLPYLLGERSPIWDPNARGVFFGLGPEHGREHMLRAVLEGVGFALRSIIEVMGENGVSVSELSLIGGGASSALWSQILAGVFNVPIILPTNPREATSYGAAVAVGVGIGLFDSFAAAKQFVKVAQVVEPLNSQLYDRVYSVYRTLYPSVKDAFRALALLR